MSEQIKITAEAPKESKKTPKTSSSSEPKLNKDKKSKTSKPVQSLPTVIAVKDAASAVDAEKKKSRSSRRKTKTDESKDKKDVIVNKADKPATDSITSLTSDAKKRRRPSKKTTKESAEVTSVTLDKKDTKLPTETVSLTSKKSRGGKGRKEKGHDKRVQTEPRQKERSKSTSSTSKTAPSLSVEETALLRKLVAQGEASRSKGGLRTGKISLTDLLDAKERAEDGFDLSRLHLASNTIKPESLFWAALHRMPPVPGFPNKRQDVQMKSSFTPELFNTTMEALSSAASLHGAGDGGGFGGTFPRGRAPRGRVSPAEVVLPWVDMTPMFPIGSSQGAPHPPAPPFNSKGGPTSSAPFNFSKGGIPGGSHQGGFRPPSSGQPFNNGRGAPNRSFQGPPMSPHGSKGGPPMSVNGHNKAARKPFFQPYLQYDVVTRGLNTGEFIKGALRVNQRNYEESYMDNPAGSEETDLLILGVQDRNRSLHGDVVAARLKLRENWVVRESVYSSWRAGKYDKEKDEDGKPMPIPPCAPAEQPPHINMLNGLVHQGDVQPSELGRIVPQIDDLTYDRKTILLIATQKDEDQREMCALTEEIQKKIEEVGLKVGDGSGRVSPTPKKSAPSKEYKRSTHRLLCDMPSEDWGMPDICLQKTAEVVYILESKKCRSAMGQLKPMADGSRSWALFSPQDPRMPRMLIPAIQLPKGFHDRPHDFARFIFIARMEEWQYSAQFARGKLERTLGEAGDIEAETEGLLIENNIDTRQFSTASLSSLPICESSQWKIDEREFKYRRDLREKTILTIDPMTARDLDDALSIDACDDIDGKGTPGWEVGVHIADVTHFLLEKTELDTWASSRATSVYLVHKVIPMLPRILCEELCSLNAGVDRLSFSVIWKMDREANVKDTWFGRTIIRSCVKMAYEHAQDMIDNPDKTFEEADLPELFNERTPADIKAKVLLLHEVASQLRSRRERDGALRLDQPKLKFVLDDESKQPCGVTIYERKDSNSLVEEFMLLANMAVARKIESAFPETSLLRSHPSPKEKVLREVLELCEKIGFPLDAGSSGLLSSSLRKFEGNSQVQTAVNQVLSMFMMKPMSLATYFCTGKCKTQAEYHHYALNTPFYTHFTSPIRRYADVMVHRLLAAALGYAPAPSLTTEEVSDLAGHCNDKKKTAKDVSEQSSEMFFGLFVKQAGVLHEKAIVVNVLDQSFDVLVLKYGVIKRVYCNRLDMARPPSFEESPPTLHLYWNPVCGKAAPVHHTIRSCSVVDVVLSPLPEPSKYMAVIKMSTDAEAKTLQQLMKELN